jgi:hypothetical protein
VTRSGRKASIVPDAKPAKLRRGRMNSALQYRAAPIVIRRAISSADDRRKLDEQT